MLRLTDKWLVVVVWISSTPLNLINADERNLDISPELADYMLVWSDEFNNSGPPDPQNWNYERGFVRNNELQWYQEQNAFCENGSLVIEARREQIKNPHFIPNSRDWRRKREFAEYSSACITTRNRHSWTYGRLVMRARIDTRGGLWPAFWTLGTERRWPACGEIDVMEYYDGFLLANVCWAGRRREPQWDFAKVPLDGLGGAEWASHFHVWQLDWDPAKIMISVDGELLNETSLQEAINQDSGQSEPFQGPHYLLLNMAVGGEHGGDPSSTELPARYEVDYVRVYQRIEPGTEATED